MHILFTRFPLESALGGAEIQTLSLMEGLIDRGHEVAFLGSCPVLLEECTRRGIPVTKLDIGAPPVTKLRALTFPMWSGEAQKKLITALEKIGPIDAVCMLSLTEKLLLTEELVARDVRVFWIEHDRVGRWLRQNPQLGRLQELSRRVMTVAVSELSRGLYRDLGWVPERTVAIPNGIDPNRFEIKPVADHQTNELHVGCIARLSPEKGIDLLIDAVAPLAHVRLSIVGKGKDEAKLRHQIERLALGDRVQIKPPVSDLGAFYQSLDVFVLPSRDNDPFGLVAAEAMMIGLPVIVTKQTGVASYLEHGVDALVVEPTSLDISKAIDLLSVLHTRQQIAQNARTTALARFTVSRMVDDYEKLMQSCIES